MASRLKTRYVDELRPRLAKDLDLGNIMAVPRLDKVVLNIGVGEAISDQNAPEKCRARFDHHGRPETGDYPGDAFNLEFFAPRRYARRSNGHAAR